METVHRICIACGWEWIEEDLGEEVDVCPECCGRAQELKARAQELRGGQDRAAAELKCRAIAFGASLLGILALIAGSIAACLL